MTIDNFSRNPLLTELQQQIETELLASLKRVLANVNNMNTSFEQSSTKLLQGISQVQNAISRPEAKAPITAAEFTPQPAHRPVVENSYSDMIRRLGSRGGQGSPRFVYSPELPTGVSQLVQPAQSQPASQPPRYYATKLHSATHPQRVRVGYTG